MQIISIEKDEQGVRADNFVTKQFNLPSRSFLQKNWSNLISINGKEEKPSYKLRTGDSVTFNDENLQSLEKEKASLDYIEPQTYKLDIVKETDTYLILNKPKGISVHPGIGNIKDTLVNYVVGYLKNNNDYDERLERGGIVHRLDKPVSGLMLFAKKYEAQKYFQKQFEEHKVNKIYYAHVNRNKNIDKSFEQYIPKEPLDPSQELDKLVANNFELDDSWYKAEGYIGRSAMNRMKMCFKTYPTGNFKYALSYLKPMSDDTILIVIKTGRMYQIRATLEYLGMNIVGDTLFETMKGGKIPEAIDLESVLLSGQDMEGSKFLTRLI